MLNDLITAVEKYNALQTNEANRLHWYNDVLSKINCITDEKEIKYMLDGLNNEIEKIKGEYKC